MRCVGVEASVGLVQESLFSGLSWKGVATLPWLDLLHPDGWGHAVALATVLSVPEIWESFRWAAPVRRERLADKNCGIVERTDL